MSNLMMRKRAALLSISAALFPAAVVAFTVGGACAAAADKVAFQTIYTFNGTDGYEPVAPFIADATGTLYSTTVFGGPNGEGNVFALAPDGTETNLYSFTGANGTGDGYNPYSGLVADSAGNLYGTTSQGGDTACGNFGCGIVFKLAPDGTETVLHSFQGGKHDGAMPAYGNLILDGKGNLYGMTHFGGAEDCGVVYRLGPDGKLKILHAFAGKVIDGCYPDNNVIADKAGNLYGTTTSRGLGYGTVFKVAPDGKETVLYSFLGGNDGSTPEGTLTEDESGNLYGTTQSGGAGGSGTVFELAPDGTKTTLYSFTGGSDGWAPRGGVYRTKSGDLYGTTFGGGIADGGSGFGVVFRLASDGTETVLHAFSASNDGCDPIAGLIPDAAAGGKGYLYGTTTGVCGGFFGTVFKVREQVSTP